MSKPESIKIDPWTDFPRQAYSIFTDDFVHEKIFTAKVNSKGEKSTVNVKLNINADKGIPTISDQVKFWFTLRENRTLFAKIKSSNYFKLHFDNHIIERWNKKWNLYASLNLNKAFENLSLRFGVAHQSERCHSDSRLRVDFNNDNKRNVTIYNRTVINHNNFTFGSLIAYGLTSNVLVKNNLLFGYKLNDNSNLFLRAQSKGFRKDNFDWGNVKGYFDHVKVDFVAKRQGNIKYGVEGVFNVKSGNPFEEALLLVEYKPEDTKLTTKTKVSTKGDVSLSFKLPGIILRDIATAYVGIHGSSLHNDRRGFKVGFQSEINV